MNTICLVDTWFLEVVRFFTQNNVFFQSHEKSIRKTDKSNPQPTEKLAAYLFLLVKPKKCERVWFRQRPAIRGWLLIDVRISHTCTVGPTMLKHIIHEAGGQVNSGISSENLDHNLFYGASYECVWETVKSRYYYDYLQNKESGTINPCIAY